MPNRLIPTSSSSSEDEPNKSSSGHDTGRPRTCNLRSRNKRDQAAKAGPHVPRREDNPFSFKHFLKKDAQSTYNFAGARPKVYSPVRRSPEQSNNLEKDSVYPRNPTELPDFVQDHLVMEQCYQNHDATAQLATDIDNLPDFALNSMEQRQSQNHTTKGNNSDATGDLPFDLTGGLNGRSMDRFNDSLQKFITDIHSYNRTNQPSNLHQQSEASRRLQEFPFDLPLPMPEPLLIDAAGPMNSPANEANVGKSLPDFLNDGPIHNRVGGQPAEPSTSSDLPERADRNLLLENEALKEDLKYARQHVAERTRMIASLNAELTSRRAADQKETAQLEKAMEQVEYNLKLSTSRAIAAEKEVTLLKQEIKALTAEISTLRSENRELRSTAGAGCADYRTPGTEKRIKRLSDELRAAATSAEGSLRQLMSGVKNLKELASALENVDRIEDRTKDFLPDFEEENAAGPAL